MILKTFLKEYGTFFQRTKGEFEKLNLWDLYSITRVRNPLDLHKMEYILRVQRFSKKSKFSHCKACSH